MHSITLFQVLILNLQIIRRFLADKHLFFEEIKVNFLKCECEDCRRQPAQRQLIFQKKSN